MLFGQNFYGYIILGFIAFSLTIFFKKMAGSGGGLLYYPYTPCVHLCFICKYSQTCVQRPPLGPQKIGRYSEGGRCSEVGPKY
jgi:hypothetical protein